MFKKLFVFVVIFLATTLKADYNQCPPPCCPDPCCEEYSKEQGPEPLCDVQAGYVAPARIDVCGCSDIFITGSFIYWYSKMEGLDSGVQKQNLANQTSDGAGRKTMHHDFEYDLGFKIGLGSHFDHDNWDLFAEYTWLSIKTSIKHNRVSNFYQWDMPWISFANPYRGYTQWKPTFHILDLELARSCYIGNRLIFRPFASGRAGWFYQKYNVQYANNEAGTETSDTKARSDSWLLGPRVGIDGSWILSNGFRLLGNAAGTLAYQHFDTKVSTINQIGQIDFKETEKEGFINPILEVGLFLAWGTYLDNNNWFFDLSAGYEIQYFFNQNRMKKLVDDPAIGFFDTGDLMFHGLTITLRLDF